ncbi:MAG: DUF192 domain-containing protein [Acidimicrobiales bacterium]
MITSSRLRRAGVATTVVLLATLAACVPTGARPELVDDTLPPDVEASAFECPEPEAPFEAFGVAAVRVITDVDVVDRCVLVADSSPLRTQGLQEVTDLAGYDGMLFVFPTDTEAWFWMQNTVLPLSIAFVDAEGHVVSTADMAPCPEAVDCPSYGPAGAYRWALEVPQGRLGDFGLGDGGSFDPTSLPTAQD